VKFFLDSADLAEIEEAATWGVLAGVTTNPTLYARIGGRLDDFPTHIKRIAALVSGPISAEVVSQDRHAMYAEAMELASLADNIVIKLPVCIEALAATKQLKEAGVAVNMTLVFSVTQALLAAGAGARYISPFLGRFDDIGEDGLNQLADIITAVNNYDWSDTTIGETQPEIIAASVRSVNHVTQAALLGADIATVPFAVLAKCLNHPLTDQGIQTFVQDWEKVRQA